MVKANGYGLGVVAVTRALEQGVDPWGFGVATVGEGRELRAAGIRRPIVVFTPARVDQLPEYKIHALQAVLAGPATTAVWDAPFHLEIDTGMARGGVRWDDRRALAGVSEPAMEGAFTHFHSADIDAGSVEVQLQRFGDAIQSLGRRPGLLHVANSAGAFRVRAPFDLARPGIFLYGAQVAADLPMPEPVAALRSRVVSVREVLPGETVSYGGEWRAARATAVATIGIGYADGVPRASQGRMQVLLHGRRCAVLGRVTMDMIMADVTPLSSRVAVGDVVTVVGRDGDDAITWDEFAAWAGTISYEVLTRLAPRLPRYYSSGA